MEESILDKGREWLDKFNRTWLGKENEKMFYRKYKTCPEGYVGNEKTGECERCYKTENKNK